LYVNPYFFVKTWWRFM